MSSFMPSLDALLTQAVALGASDLHLCAGRVPMVRLHGTLVALV
jgi:twitching motility protein PilT